ncbi:MAG: hypothetical protein LPK02_07055 [Rhodobacterales bacterium]|nr:hypothetical protein [Rhodobacterales bacterium]
MSYTIYPAIIVDQEDGTKLLDNLLPLGAQDAHALRPEVKRGEDYEGDPFTVNPNFLPGAGMDMSSGNWFALLRLLDIPYSKTGVLHDVEQVINRCYAALDRGHMEMYNTVRTVQLLNIAQVAHTRGGMIAFG